VCPVFDGTSKECGVDFLKSLISFGRPVGASPGNAVFWQLLLKNNVHFNNPALFNPSLNPCIVPCLNQGKISGYCEGFNQSGYCGKSTVL